MKGIFILILVITPILLVACGNELQNPDDYQPAYTESHYEPEDDYESNETDDVSNNDQSEETLSEDQINLQNADPIVIENHPVIGTWRLIEDIQYYLGTDFFDNLAHAKEHIGIEEATQPLTLHADGRVTFSLGGESRWGFRVDAPDRIVLRSGDGGQYFLENNILTVLDEFPDGTIVRRTFERIE